MPDNPISGQKVRQGESQEGTEEVDDVLELERQKMEEQSRQGLALASLRIYESILRDHGGYSWLLDTPDKLFWSVSEIVAEFEKVGMKLSNDGVARWIKPLEHTQNFGGAAGLRATRADLIKFFAQKSESPKRMGRAALTGEGA